IPLTDVDLDATRAAVTKAVVVTTDAGKKLKVSASERERLLRELEQNHAGKPSSAASADRIPEPREAEPANSDEWSWRTAARAHEEAVRRAKENVDLLRTRATALQQQIQQFFALGYRANQFTYQSSELEITQAQLPAAELEVTRA